MFVSRQYALFSRFSDASQTRDEALTKKNTYRVLKSPRVRERHVPRVRLLVHGVQVHGGVQLGQATGQEHDARGFRRDSGVEHLQGVRGDFLGVGLLRAVGARGNHGRLQEHAVELDVVVGQVLEGLRPNHGGDFEVAVDVVVTVEEDLRFDDRDETGVLADGRVAGEAVSAVRHGDLGRTGRDGDDGAPLAEARALLVVLSRAFGEAVETLAPRLAVGVGERPEALVNLDTRVHAFLAERVDERGAILARLVQGFFEENRTADVFAHTLVLMSNSR